MEKGKLVWLMLLTICCVGNVLAQKKDEKPNFSGKWVSNSKKSYYQIPNSSLSNDLKHCAYYLTIIHNDPELNIIAKWVCFESDDKTKSPKTSESTETYFTDGRVENNLNQSSQATWKKNQLTIIKETKQGVRNGSITSKIVYYLSKDGKSLIQKREYLPNQATGLIGVLGGVRTITFDLTQ